MMKEMHWTWRELLDTPVQVILAHSFIHGRINAYDKLQTLKHDSEKKK